MSEGWGWLAYRDIVDRAKQQVSVGVAVDLGLPLEDHRLVVQGLDDLWLLLHGTEGRGDGSTGRRDGSTGRRDGSTGCWVVWYMRGGLVTVYAQLCSMVW